MEVRLESLSERSLLVAPVRLMLGLVGLVAVSAVADDRAAAQLAFLLGALALLVLALADPRSHFYRLREDPPPPPEGAVRASRAQLVTTAIFPSTVGVSVLTVAALPLRPVLAALLAGSLAGMGLAALVSAARLLTFERANGVTFLAEHGTGRIFVERGGVSR